MDDFLADYRRKRARAETHFKSVAESLENSAGDVEPIPGKFDRDLSRYIFEFPTPFLDPELALVIGDCVYNLRACLDYLIAALVRSMGEEEDHRTQFPIYSLHSLPKNLSWENWEPWWDTGGAVSQKLRGTPPNTSAALKQLQPLYGVPSVNPNDHPLTALQELSNADKHRRVNVMATRIPIKFTDAQGTPRFQIEEPDAFIEIAESSKTDTQRVLLRVDETDDGAELNLVPAYHVRFNGSKPPFHRGVVATLTSIREFIDRQAFVAVRALLRR